MRTHYILAALFIYSGATLKLGAQIFSGSAKGKSTILYDGTALGFNITDPSLDFTLNNFRNETYRNKDQHLVWGISSSAASADGYSNFFNSGNVSANLTASGFIGWNWLTGKKQFTQEYDSIFQQMKLEAARVNAHIQAEDSALFAFAEKKIDAYKPARTRQAENTALKSDLKNFFNVVTLLTFTSAFRENLTAKHPADTVFLKSLETDLKRRLTESYARLRTAGTVTRKLYSELESRRAYWLNRYTIYLSPSYVSRSFKFYKLDTAKYSNSFTDKLFAGGGISAGFNWNIGTKWLLGTTAGYLRDDNSAELKSAEYTLKENYQNNSQQLVSEKKITAKKGDYHNALDLYPVNIDVIYFLPVPRNDSTVIAFNAYMHHMSSGMLKARPETTDLGIAIYFFSNRASKFLGGIYFEAPDIHNNIARNDPEATLKPLRKRLTFGITTKLTFSTLSSLLN